MAPRLIADNIMELLPMKRSPGNHVSEIINRLAISQAIFADSGTFPPQVQLEMGNAAELAIADAFAKRYSLSHPGRYLHGFEVEKDGIFGNIDLLDTVDFAVEDVKLTKKSLRHPIESKKYWHNWAQVKTYCHMIGSHIGRLHIVFVNGNYSKDRDDPDASWVYRCWEDVFEDRDLLNNWKMVYGHRKIK